MPFYAGLQHNPAKPSTEITSPPMFQSARDNPVHHVLTGTATRLRFGGFYQGAPSAVARMPSTAFVSSSISSTANKNRPMPAFISGPGDASDQVASIR